MAEHLEGRAPQLQRHPLVALVVPVVAGIYLDRVGHMPLIAWCSTALLSWLAWCYCRRHLHQNLLWRHRLATGLLLSGFLCTAAAWHQLRWDRFPADDIGRRAPDVAGAVCIRVQSLEVPQQIRADEQDRLRAIPAHSKSLCDVCAVAVRDGRAWRKVSGRMRLRVAGQLLGVQPGDTLEVLGQLQRPTPSANPGGFSFDDYERSQRRLATLRAAYPQSVSIVGRSSVWHPRWMLARLRNLGHQMLWRYLPRDQAELAAALLLGNRDHLDRERSDAFLHTGTVHLLAISGLHVSIMAFGLYFLARTAIVPPRWALVGVMLATALYAVMSGGRAPVIRATILVFVFCTASLLRRDSLSFNSLAAAALIVLGLNPCQLFHAGAQLSFLAVAAMIWYVPLLTRRRPMTPVERLLARRRSYLEVVLRIGARQFANVAMASLVIWCVALPLVMHRFHLVSPSALLLNLFLWIPLGIALFGGFGILLFGWIAPPLAELSAVICREALVVLEGCVRHVEPMAGSYFWVAGPPAGFVAVFYAVLIAGVVIYHIRRWWPSWTAIAYLVVACGCWNNPAPRADDAPPLQCSFLSVGHGSCAVLELPCGAVWLYDAGSLGSSRAAVSTISNFLWSRGITRVEAIILSHADLDHFNAVPGLLERFSVGTVFVSPTMFSRKTPSVSLLQRTLAHHKVPVRELAAGHLLVGDKNVQLEILHPPRVTSSSTTRLESDNASSLVVAVECREQVILLTGDLETEGLDSLLAQPRRDCGVLLAPHHGSLRSQPREICQWCTPEWVIVSSAGGPSSGVPAYDQAGCRVLQTAQTGCVQVTLDWPHTNFSTFRGQDVAAGDFSQPE